MNDVGMQLLVINTMMLTLKHNTGVNHMHALNKFEKL